MKLTVHMIPAAPTADDPLAQRAYAALIWGPDNQLIAMAGDLDPTDAAAHVALTVAADVISRMVPTLHGRAAGEALLARLQKALDEDAPRG